MNKLASLFVTNIQFDQTDEVISLYEMANRYRRDTWLKPLHQREVVWDKNKRKDWINRIKRGPRPSGTIVTYQIIDNGTISPIYINDGFQRINATVEYLETPSVYGDSIELAEQYIQAFSYLHQHRHYPNHDVAMEEFQGLNLGTALTPYEFCKGIIEYMPSSIAWNSKISELHDLIPLNQSGIVSGRTALNREEQHKYYRHDYSLFHRYIQGSEELADYSITESRVKREDVINKKVIEWKLRILLEDKTPDQGEELLTSLKRLIERETALVKDIWFNKLDMEFGFGISKTLYRWIIDCAIWKKHKQIPQSEWEEFLILLLRVSRGKSQISEIEGAELNRKYTLNLGKLSSLKGICEIIGSDLYKYKKEKRQPVLINLQPGYDESHYDEFKNNGNGETFPEPAGRNRARGAKPVKRLLTRE